MENNMNEMIEQLQKRIEELEKKEAVRRIGRDRIAGAARAIHAKRFAIIKVMALVVLCGTGIFLYAATINPVPNSFQAGDPIKASEVNSNFATLSANDQAINTELAGKATLASPTFTGILTINSPSAGPPATSGPSDPNIVSRVWCSSIALDTGVYGSGVAWMQNRMYNNNASNFSMVLQPNGGNVGIGTESPAYKFDVAGDIRATGSVYYGGSSGSANGTLYSKPDFIFEPDYKTMTIDEIVAFIDKNRHLPWVTSAKLEKSGAVNMTRMNFETLEAVENIQLQIITLFRENKLLQEKNDELRIRLDALEKKQ